MVSQAEVVDVLVIGSGAAGMSAAITAAAHGLKVLVVEKQDKFGGTTARSGGWLWVPGTSLAAAQGITEPAGAAKTYLRHEAGTSFDEAKVDAFLNTGPKAIDFFLTQTELELDLSATFSDYHAEAPGGAAGGRSMVTRSYDGRALGTQLSQLAPPLPELTLFGMMIGSGQDMIHLRRATRSPASMLYIAKRLALHGKDVLRHGRGMTLTNGNALAARLHTSAMRLGIPLWLKAPATQLLFEDGQVNGALIERDGRPVTVRAARGVVLACGGFPFDLQRRNELFPHVALGAEHVTPSPASNTGDGLRMAEAAGATVDKGIANAAAWVPVSKVPRKDGSTGVFPHFIDRAKPGVIAVTADGQRFVNEARSYHDFVQALVAVSSSHNAVSSPQNAAAAWLICDHRALRKYGLGVVAPFPLPIGRHLRNGYLLSGDTIDELARKAGISAQGLSATIARYNEPARLGQDPEFDKGSTPYNRFQGDAEHLPNPCIAPIENGPFYAIRLYIGDIGTFAGLKTNEHSQVIAAAGQPIAGLYAVGNDIASIMGGNYPGGGITLGPALVFGYIAGYHLASSPWQLPDTVAQPVAVAVSNQQSAAN